MQNTPLDPTNDEVKAAFTDEALSRIRRAGADLSFLVDHDYDLQEALSFVGDHHNLSELQRQALTSSICGEQHRFFRAEKSVALEAISGQAVLVDGLSILHPVECALRGMPCILAQDETLHALGDFDSAPHDVAQTMHAADVVIDVLARAGAASICFYLDNSSPYSERLSTTITDYAKAMVAITRPGLVVTTQLSSNLHELYSDAALIATNDPQTITVCKSWIPMAQPLIDALPGAWVIDPVFG